MVSDNLGPESVEQYKKEERSAIARRLKGSHIRIHRLIECMSNDKISTPEKIDQLKMDLKKYTGDLNFKEPINTFPFQSAYLSEFTKAIPLGAMDGSQ